MIIGLYQSTIAMATPLILISLGGLMGYHAGVINVAMEGLVLASAFAAVVFSYLFSNAWVGILTAVVVAVILSCLYSFFVTTLKANNFAIGFAINIFVSSFTLYLSNVLFVGENAFNSSRIEAIPNLKINFGVDILDSLFSNFSVLTYVSILFMILISYVIYKTPFGLHLRAAGSSPNALKTAGIRVPLIQYSASIITGIFCGFAGAQLSLSNVVMFTRDMSSGRGFICLAAILISGGKPKIVVLLSLLFGFLEALSLQLQTFDIPVQFLFMLPYVMTIFSLITIQISKRGRTN